MLLPLNLNVATNIIRVINVIMNTYLIQLKDGLKMSLMKSYYVCVCKHEMRIRDYMMVEMCPRCKAHFNSRCKFHYHLYFEV